MKRPETLNQIQKRERFARNKAWFLENCFSLNLEVVEFNGGKHLRAVGIDWIDYWPARGTWWVVGGGRGSKDNDALLTVLVKNQRAEMGEEAKQHMREIVNCG